jgi:hypothetical protein
MLDRYLSMLDPNSARSIEIDAAIVDPFNSMFVVNDDPVDLEQYELIGNNVLNRLFIFQ